MRHDNFLKILIIAIALWSSSCLALSSDTKQPINIESDRAERNEKLGVTIYQGSVVISQGSIRIEADTVSIYNQKNQVERIVCQGNLARYEQQGTQSEKPLIAYAKTIEYSIVADTIVLKSMASLEHDGATITGERIQYDLKKEVVKAKGDTNGNQRIQMVIPAEALNKGAKTP